MRIKPSTLIKRVADGVEMLLREVFPLEQAVQSVEEAQLTPLLFMVHIRLLYKSIYLLEIY